MAAIFGALVFINRQTAGMLQEFLIYVYPLPIAVYTARYGFKTSWPAAVAMVLLAFFLGSVNYAFYSGTSLLTGLVFGECLYRKTSSAKTVFFVVLISIAVALADLLIMASLSGITLESQAVEMQGIMQESLGMVTKMLGGQNTEQTEQLTSTLSGLFTLDYLKQMIVLSTVLAGAVQGFLIYALGLLIMRRLRIRVPKPISLYEFRPPVWTAFAALVCFLIYTFGLQKFMNDEEVRNGLLTIGMVGYLYLMIFGLIGGSLWLRLRMPGHKFLPVLISFLGMFIFPVGMVAVGFLYITGIGGFFPEASGKEGPGSRTTAGAEALPEPGPAQKALEKLKSLAEDNGEE